MTALLVGTAVPIGAVDWSAVAGGPQATVSQVVVLETTGSAVQESALSLDTQIDAWIAKLSLETGFGDWKNASWQKHALGPGQHGWVVIVEEGTTDVVLGYLIVGATPEGEYVLVEYGLGDSPLFSYETLREALSSEEVAFTEAAFVERIYAGPMQALWKVSEAGVTRFADAKTGIWLPIEEMDVSAPLNGTFGGILPESSHPRQRLHKLQQPGDPYMSLAWLDTDAAPVKNWTTFMQWLERANTDAIYASSAFDGKALTPIGVAGYHVWAAAASDDSGKAQLRGFVALEHEGLRYVPLASLLAVGAFH
jgi:hypothetical protein